MVIAIMNVTNGFDVKVRGQVKTRKYFGLYQQTNNEQIIKLELFYNNITLTKIYIVSLGLRC